MNEIGRGCGDVVTLLHTDEQMGSRIQHVFVWTAETQGSHRKGLIRVRENEGRLRVSAEAELQQYCAQAQVFQNADNAYLRRDERYSPG